MEAMRQMTTELRTARTLYPSVIPNGAREGDSFLLDAFQEKKRTLKLNRTSYRFLFDDHFNFDFIKSEIKLPVFGGATGGFEMILVASTKTKMHNQHSRYLFRSLGETPFKLNGSYSYEAFLERGDVIDLGFNRLHFLRPQRQTSEESLLPAAVMSSSLPVLIEGETGTGKTTLAKKIHEASGRSGRFVHLNLSAFSQGLIESELFGHVRGAFTGALNAKRGAILEAHKGTLFLDEIDSLSLDLQTKLLLFLDNYEVRPVGGESTTTASVRMIFASGSDLKKRVMEGKMRRDFYYRLRAGSSLRLNSLIEDKERIKKLCLDFEKEHCAVLSDELIDFYMNCPWPGNIRQLNSHLMRKKILSEGKRLVIDESDKELMFEEGERVQKQEIIPMEQMKIKYCYETYLRSDKNLTRTAKLLDVSHNTLKAYIAKKESELRDNKIVHINLQDFPFDS